MRRTRIKICGVMRAEDAEAAVEAGADAIGFVFHSAARRCISSEQAAAIVARLPPFVTGVGLFVDQPPALILAKAGELGLGCVQLHGAEKPELVQALRPLGVIKAIRVQRATIESELNSWRDAIERLSLWNLRGLLLDSDARGHAGGAGHGNDWETVLKCRRQGLFESFPALMVAGGLTPENVNGVVRDIQPWAVDVSSGVEESFGKKSSFKLARFVEAVRAADNES